VLEEDDGPGEDGEENEQEQDQLDDDIGFGDDLENIDIHDYPLKNVAHDPGSVKPGATARLDGRSIFVI
jgi:hypothetical protein